MAKFILRQLWRAIIFIAGILTLRLLIEIAWPESRTKFGIFMASVAIYCLMAYIVIPGLFRIYHLIIEHDHIPLYATYGDGWASDPVNIAIVARDKRHLIAAFTGAGWYLADQGGIKNNLHEMYSILFNRPYPNAPVSSLYLFNRRHDIAFEIPTNGKMSARTRHHVRFWRLEPPILGFKDRGHFKFWSERLRHWMRQENEIWIGASTEDFRPLDIRWRTGSLTHGVRHDAHKERDFIVKTLKQADHVSSTKYSRAGKPYTFRGQSFKTKYTTDGSLEVVTLR